MAVRSSLDHVLRNAPRLVGLSRADDILGEASRMACNIAGTSCVVAGYACPPLPWERGLHLVLTDGARPATGAERSALFAVHRRLAASREPTMLRSCEENQAILRGLGCAGSGTDGACAVPLLHPRNGRLVGELVVVGPVEEDAVSPLVHVAALTAAALATAQRLATARCDQDRLLLLAETTDETLWDWNLDTGAVWWSSGIQKLLGSAGDAAQPRIEWRDGRIHPDDIDRVRDSLRRHLTSDASSWTEPYRFRRSDGSWAQVEDRGYVMRDASGRPFRVVGVLRDVTPLHETNEALRVALAASHVANRAKDEFLAMLGHELRNPLSPMRVALEVVRMRGEHSRELDVLDRQVDHLTRLVDDLLDVARIVRGKVVLRRAPVEIGQVVARAIEMASPLIEAKQHALEVRVAPGLVVDVDESRLAQVLSNLLSNAAKYSDPRSKIEVVAERAGGVVRICVVDRGVGITAAMIDHVFELFVQQSQTLDRSQGGLGLGLAIAKNLVEMHGGTVRASSGGPGRGSTFTVELPFCETATRPAPREEADSAPIAGNGMRILVVDDNHDAADMLKVALELFGHRVEVAHDGPTALEISEPFAPDLALLDIGLPVMDGYELAGRLRKKRTASELRLIALTGYGQEEDRRLTAAAGFDVHLVKPIDLDELQRVIERIGEVRP